MNNFLEETEKLLNSIEHNTSEYWKEYYKDVPIECIYDDLVIDINEIKRLQERYNKALELLLELDLPCEIDNFMTENSDYCCKNCGVDEETYKKCWDKFIKWKLEEK